jgi:hypothetical protein
LTHARLSALKLLRRWPPQALLLVTFACFYFAIGPGNFFAVDEVMEEETAQELILRRNLGVAAMQDTRPGRAQSYYTVKGPGLPLASLPFVYLGLKLDDALGSMNGGPLAGSPIGSEEQPLRWGGRLAISAALTVNALVGAAIVAVLFLVGIQLSPNRRAALLMAIAAGLATLVMSEATHFYQHALDALMVILAFWFFAGQETGQLEHRALFGGMSLGVAMLARPDAVPAAVVLWLYGIAAAWRLVRNFSDRWPRMIRRTLLSGVGPLGAIAGTMYFNFLRFGSVTQFGYTESRARFVIDVAQVAKAIAGYLLSPSLSIFLFSAPLILVLAVGRRAYRRWPLETATLIFAATAHLMMIALNRSWHGDLSYGPRYMLEFIVLLMPLTLPAFEIAADSKSWRPAVAVGAVVVFGMAVQLIGVAVFVAANEWYRTAAGIVDGGAFAFVPSASPIIVDLKEIIAGRNLAPWAIRAWAHPGPALVLWIGLIAIVLAGARWLIGYFRAPTKDSGAISSERLPVAIVLVTVLPILAGFALVRPITDAPNIRTFNFIEAGLAAQAKGESVAASEDYAMVLSLDPSNKFARFDLGILEQDAGHTDAALSLYAGALRADPNFTPARLRMANILQARAAK